MNVPSYSEQEIAEIRRESTHPVDLRWLATIDRLAAENARMREALEAMHDEIAGLNLLGNARDLAEMSEVEKRLVSLLKRASTALDFEIVV